MYCGLTQIGKTPTWTDSSGRHPDRRKTARCRTSELKIPSYKTEGHLHEHWIVASALHYTSGKGRLKAIQTWKGSLMRTAKMQDPNEDARARIVHACHRTPRKEQKITTGGLPGSS